MFLSFQLVTIGRDIVYIINDNLNFIDILFYRTDNIFLYFTSSFTNLQEEIINVHKFQYGRESMQIFIEFFNFITGNRTPENIFQSSLEIHNYNEAYNTGTYLREHYRDFGLIGIILFPFLYGLIATFTYLKFLNNPSIKHIAIYSIISTILISAFFSNHFLKIQYIFWIFVIIIFTKFKIINVFK